MVSIFLMDRMGGATYFAQKCPSLLTKMLNLLNFDGQGDGDITCKQTFTGYISKFSDLSSEMTIELSGRK